MKVSIYMAVSTNGMISNEKGVPDWLSKEYEEGFMAICQKTKAVIMGKTTYKILAPDYLPLTNRGTTTVVLTHDIEEKSTNPTVVFTDKKPNDVVAMLEEKGHQEAVVIGGAITISELMQAGLVDEIYFVVEPVLFGNGLPLFKETSFEYQLNLLEVKKLNENTVQLHYQVLK
jgi:dihydrofolate reductase